MFIHHAILYSLILTLRSSQILFLELSPKMAKWNERKISTTISTEGHIEVIEQKPVKTEKINNFPGRFFTMNSLTLCLSTLQKQLRRQGTRLTKVEKSMEKQEYYKLLVVFRRESHVKVRPFYRGHGVSKVSGSSTHFLPLESEDNSMRSGGCSGLQHQKAQRSEYILWRVRPSCGGSCERSMWRPTETMGPRRLTRSAPLCGGPGWCGSAARPALTTPSVNSSAETGCTSWSRPGGSPSEGFLVRTVALTARRRNGCSFCALDDRHFLWTPSPAPPWFYLCPPPWSLLCPEQWPPWTWKSLPTREHFQGLFRRCHWKGKDVRRMQILCHRSRCLSGRLQCPDWMCIRLSSTYHTH